MSLAKVSFILADIFRYLYRRVFCVLCINSWNSTRKNAENELEELRRTSTLNQDSISGGTSDQQSGSLKDKPLIEVKDADDESSDETDNSRVKIPLVIVVGCLLAYIVFGAYIFTLLEELTWVEGIYYSYVSLATIGNSFLHID